MNLRRCIYVLGQASLHFIVWTGILVFSLVMWLAAVAIVHGVFR